MRKLLLIILMALSVNGIAQDTTKSTASYYHKKFEGRKTASGAKYDGKKLTAASNKYKLGTKLLIINKSNGKSVIVEVNDRTAKSKSHRIDLSRSAFKKIAELDKGLQKIKVIEL